jgi:type IV secretory pathway VirB3-like protein
MSLSIDDALREGFGRTIARPGLLLIAAFLVFGFLNAVVSQSLSQATFDELATSVGPELAQQTGDPNPFAGAGGENPFAVTMSAGLAGGLALLLGFVAEALRIVSIRVFASESPDSIPSSVTRRPVAATINGVVAGILVGIATAVGLVFLIVPGLFIALSFFFVRQEVAVEDKNFIDAMSDSWTLTKGDRWELLGLALILIVVSFLVGSPALLLQFLDPTVGSVLNVVLGAATTVFAIAVTTRAYEQLRRERAARMDPDAGSLVDEFPGQSPDDGF